MDRGMRRRQEQTKSVQRPAPQSAALQQKLAPKMKLEDATSLLDSVIDELHPLDAPRTPRQTKKLVQQQSLGHQNFYQQHVQQQKEAHQQQFGHASPPQQQYVQHQPTWQQKLMEKRSSQAQQEHNPFATINDERINPSRVEAVHNIFEKKRHSSAGRQPIRQSSKELIQEPVYSEISEFQQPRNDVRSHSKLKCNQNYSKKKRFIKTYLTL